MANTGYQAYTTLEQYYVLTGLPTGVTKPNDPGDPDYVAPVLNLIDCPLPTTTSTTSTTTTAEPTTSTTTTTTTAEPTTTSTTSTTTTEEPTTSTTTTTTTLEPTTTTSTTTTTTTLGIATFTGDFILCVASGSTADYRAQDGSATVGHFTTTSPITANNCSGGINVTGSLTSAQGPLIILVPSVPGGNTATIVAQGIGATNAAVTTAVVGDVLRIIITPNSYPTTVSLGPGGTLTVTFP
jgi:hypothetical protein